MAVVLVTGGTGLVGGNLIRKLVEQDFEVRALVRPKANTSAFDNLPVKKLEGDILDVPSLEKATAGVDYVFHCAAMVSMWKYAEKKMREVNVKGTENVLTVAIQKKVKRFLHISTVDALGFATRDGWGTLEKPSTEEIPYQNDWMGVPYGKTKWEAQELVLKALREEKIDGVILNPAYMLGPYDIKPTSGRMVLEIKKGMAWGYTSGGNNVVDVEDAVLAMICAIEKGRRGELYILGNENLTYHDLFTRVSKVVGVKPPRFSVPYPMARLVGFSGDVYGILSGKEPKISSGEILMAYLPHYFSPEKARIELGLQATPIEKAIEKAYRWFLENKYI